MAFVRRTVYIQAVDSMSPMPAVPFLDISGSSRHTCPPPSPENENLSGENDDDEAPPYSAEPGPGECTQMQAPPPGYSRLPPLGPGVRRVRFVLDVEEITDVRVREDVGLMEFDDDVELGVVRRRLLDGHGVAPIATPSRWQRFYRRHRLQFLALAMVLAMVFDVGLARSA